MRLKLVVFIAFVTCFVGVGLAQSTRDVNTPKPPVPKYQAYKKQKKTFFLFRSFNNKKQQTDADEAAEFRKQVAKRLEARTIEEEKASRKPQYTNPLYFGHKRPPKKRKVGKKKFCKECGLVH